jgi:hypothetical protein
MLDEDGHIAKSNHPRPSHRMNWYLITINDQTSNIIQIAVLSSIIRLFISVSYWSIINSISM